MKTGMKIRRVIQQRALIIFHHEEGQIYECGPLIHHAMAFELQNADELYTETLVPLQDKRRERLHYVAN